MMNVLMSGDARVYPGIEIAIYSMMTHNKNVNWYILTMDIVMVTDTYERCYVGLQDNQKDKLRKIVNYLDSNSHITFIDAYDLYAKYLAGSVNDLSAFTPYAALRLIADKVLPNCNEFLYLDCDVAIMKNIESMYYDCASKKEEIAFGVYEPEACNWEGEMVSGVMFFNLDTARRYHFFEHARQNYKQNEYPFPDQMAMRDTAKVARLDPTYGYMWDYKKLNASPAILHFTNELVVKPYTDNHNLRYFYKVYPELEYIYKGTKLLDTIIGL